MLELGDRWERREGRLSVDAIGGNSPVKGYPAVSHHLGDSTGKSRSWERSHRPWEAEGQLLPREKGWGGEAASEERTEQHDPVLTLRSLLEAILVPYESQR